MAEIFEEHSKEWRHRFYKLGKDESYKILETLGYWRPEDLGLPHEAMKKMLLQIVKDGNFESFRRLVTEAEERIEAKKQASPG
jgi:hypothetical protein